MTGSVVRVAWYRLRTTFRSRRGGYLAIVLLIGLVGGTSLASAAAARRTQSSFPRFFTGTRPSDLIISLYGVTPSAATHLDPAGDITRKITRIPGVSHVERLVAVNGLPLLPSGRPDLSQIMGSVGPLGSMDGLDFDQDRPRVVHGRMADPARADEFVTSPQGARSMGFHLGEVVPFGFYTNAQSQLPGFGTARVKPFRRVDARLVGLVVFNDEVVQDDVDRPATSILFTPALTRPLVAAGGIGSGGATYYGARLAHGRSDIVPVEQAFTRLLPPGAGYEFHDTGPVEAKALRALKPESIALGVFGAIAGLAALLIAGQAIARQFRASDVDVEVLRALGAGPRVTLLDGLLGSVSAVVVGAFLAASVAVAASPLAPVGPVRAVDPSRGIDVDWTVIGAGLAILTLGLGGVALLLAYRGAPHRAARRAEPSPPRSSRVVSAVAGAGLPVSAEVGLRFALESGAGRTRVPVRSALLANALAVVTLAATLTFASSLHTLVSRPSLYGWNWNDALIASNDVPPQTVALAAHDPDVEASSGYGTVVLDFDGRSVPSLIGATNSAVAPPMLSGHAVDGPREVVLGPATMAELHKHVGDVVHVGYGNAHDAPLYVPPTAVRIVGTATMPAIGQPLVAQDHTSMGIGAVVPVEFETPALVKATRTPVEAFNGPNVMFVRWRPSVGAAAGRAEATRLARAADAVFAGLPNGSGVGYSVTALGVQRPAEIVNYRTMGATPGLLAAGLAIGAVVSLGLTLSASVRRRRRDLAVLKTMGCTSRQLAASVAWHASITAVIGVLVGLPLGVVAGRQLWVLFARTIYAVPQPTVPAAALAAVALGALVLANLVATPAGASAARTRTAVLLRAE